MWKHILKLAFINLHVAITLIFTHVKEDMPSMRNEKFKETPWGKKKKIAMPQVLVSQSTL